MPMVMNTSSWSHSHALTTVPVSGLQVRTSGPERPSDGNSSHSSIPVPFMLQVLVRHKPYPKTVRKKPVDLWEGGNNGQSSLKNLMTAITLYYGLS